MFHRTMKKALLVASVALTLPVVGATAASASQGADGRDAGHPTHTKEVTAADPSGASSNPDGTFQGKSRSTPDQDGKGMDRGVDNNDKTGPGTDGNNGCGNEPRLAAPRDGGRPTDDDSNGWCGSKPKPAKPAKRHAAPAAVAAPAAAPAAPVVDAVAAPAAAAAPAPAHLSVTAHSSRARHTVRALGTGSTDGAVVAAAAVAPLVGPFAPAKVGPAAPLALPFTGAPVGLLLVLAGFAVGIGALLLHVGARRTA